LAWTVGSRARRSGGFSDANVKQRRILRVTTGLDPVVHA
jgi:hypothetical protein